MQKIQLLTRALIIRDNQVLLAKGKGFEHTFLPVGHINLKESAKEALERELQEETGTKIKIRRYLGAIEHSFDFDDNYQQEINHIFLAELNDNKQRVKSKESHLNFLWIDINDLKKNNLEPTPLQKLIPKIIKNKNLFFWKSTIK